MQPVQLVAPASLVTVEEARDRLRVTSSEDDGVITGLISAAAGYLDGLSGILGRCICVQTWRSFSAGWYDLRLPFPDAQSVASVTYFDAANSLQTLDASSYRLSNDAQGGLFELVGTANRPAVYDRPDAIRIDVVYGFAVPPAAIRQAALFLIEDWYDNDGSKGIPMTVTALIAPFRVLT